MITEPRVTQWAHTHVDLDMFQTLGPDGTEIVSDADFLAEGAGRACYDSFSRPSPKTATTDTYIKNILDLHHYSVLAHGSVTFYIEGVSRSLTHELIRSRFLAFSQLSQRYVNSSDMDWVCPPQYLENIGTQELLSNLWDDAISTYEIIVREDMDRGVPRKRAYEAARSVLPNMTETKIVVTGNHRAYRDFIEQRWTASADLEIQRLAGIILERLRDVAPATYSDMI